MRIFRFLPWSLPTPPPPTPLGTSPNEVQEEIWYYFYETFSWGLIHIYTKEIQKKMKPPTIL